MTLYHLKSSFSVKGELGCLLQYTILRAVAIQCLNRNRHISLYSLRQAFATVARTASVYLHMTLCTILTQDGICDEEYY